MAPEYDRAREFLNLTGIADEVSMMTYGNRRVLVERLPIDVNSSGPTTLVAARPGYALVVTAYSYMSNGAVNVHFRSNSAPITGPSYLPEAGRGKVNPYNPKGWCATEVGEALNIHLSAGTAVGGEFTFVAIEV